MQRNHVLCTTGSIILKHSGKPNCHAAARYANFGVDDALNWTNNVLFRRQLPLLHFKPNTRLKSSVVYNFAHTSRPRLYLLNPSVLYFWLAPLMICHSCAGKKKNSRSVPNLPVVEHDPGLILLGSMHGCITITF